MIVGTTLEEITLPEIDILYVTIQSINERIDENSLMVTKYSPNLLFSLIRPQSIRQQILGKTILFSDSNLKMDVDRLKKVCYIVETVDLAYVSVPVLLHVKFSPTKLERSQTKQEFYGARNTATTQVIIVDRIDLVSDVFMINYHQGAIDQISLTVSHYMDSFDMYILKTIGNEKSLPLQKTIQSFGSLQFGKETMNLPNQSILLTCKDLHGASTLLQALARRLSIPLIKVSRFDLINGPSTVENDVTQRLTLIVGLALSQKRCILLFDDFYEITSSSSKSNQKFDPEFLEYDLRISRIIYSVIHSFLSSSYHQQLLPIVLSPDEHILDQSLVSQFLHKYDLNYLLLSTPQQLFLQICELYGEENQNFDHYSFSINSSSSVPSVSILQYLFLPGKASSEAKLRFDTSVEALQAVGFHLQGKDTSEGITTKIGKDGNRLYGCEKIIKAFEELIIWPIKFRNLYEQYGLSSSKTTLPVQHVLVYGPTGCGKTSLPKLLSETFHFSLLETNLAAVTSSAVGGTEKEIIKLFAMAKKQAPCFLVIDELTAIFRKDENNGDYGSASADKTIISTFLHALEDINNWNQFNQGYGNTIAEQFKYVIVIGITREPWRLPNRFFGYGRFQQRIYMENLNDIARKEFFLGEMSLFCEESLSETFLDILVMMTAGFTGADLRKVYQKVQNYLLLNTATYPTGKVTSVETLQEVVKQVLHIFSPSVSLSTLKQLKEWKH